MRKGWRWAWSILGLVLLIAGETSGSGTRLGRADTAIRMTLDISWGDPALPALPPGTKPKDETVLELEVGEGRVIEASSAGESPWNPRVGPDGYCRLGVGPSGKVRVRIETTSGSTLLAKTGGVPTRFGVAALFEGQLRTAANGAVPIQIERVPWDSLEVHLGPDAGSDGIFAPGSMIPMTLGFNILVPEPADVGVKYWIEMRKVGGDDSVWSLPARREVMGTNATRPPGVRLTIPAPKADGSYVLDVHATWEPAANAEGSRLARLFKKRRGNASVDVIRRVSFAVIGPKEPKPEWIVGPETISDSLDLSRARTARATSSGRSPASGGSWAVPESSLVDASRRDRLRGWNPFGGSEGVVLAPADGRGLSWTATPLKVTHPGRPHQLTVRLVEGRPSDLGVALVAPGDASNKPRMLLDSSASGPPIGEGGVPASFSWTVWPSDDELVLILVNRSEVSAAKPALVELREQFSNPNPAVVASTEPAHATARKLALHLGDLNRFGGGETDGPPDLWAMAQNVASYAMHCGASSLVLTSSPSERIRRAALEGQADEDSTRPDRLEIVLRSSARKKLTAMLEVRFDGPLPGLPGSDSAEALTRGLVRIDRNGKADGTAFQPLRAEVREAMTTRLVTALARREANPNLLGVIVRLGPGSTLPGSPDVGFDDVTYGEFVRSAFQPDAVAKVPGLDRTDPRRFAARWQFVTGPGRENWLDWRADRISNLYSHFDAAVKAASPNAILAISTPGVDDGPAGIEARHADRVGLSASLAWKAVGLDLERWPNGPVVLRGVGLSTDDLGHDLATNSDLDAAVAPRPGCGFWYGVEDDSATTPGPLRLSARPIADGPPGDEPLGHALAVLDARWVIVSGSAIAGQEGRISRFAEVFRALPATANGGPPAPRLDSGVAVRSWVESGKTYVAMANDTPYVVLLESVLRAPADATVEDLGRRQRLVPATLPGGGKSLVIELAPFGVAALRVASPTARIEPIGPHLPAGRDLDDRREHLSNLLDKMTLGETGSPPRNGNFEETASVVTRASRSSSPAKIPGWVFVGEGGSIELDSTVFHAGGATALRLEAKAPGVSAASQRFSPPGGVNLSAKAWIKADRAETPIRLWIEGQAAGKPFSRWLDTKVGTTWTECRAMVGDMPEGGLDKIRIRFEKKTPGVLWIDDVAMNGEGPAESTRRAQVVLTAALHAYRERRYADFARLSGSHWAKEAEPDWDSPLMDRSLPIRAAGTPTDLPASRRLR